MSCLAIFQSGFEDRRAASVPQKSCHSQLLLCARGYYQYSSRISFLKLIPIEPVGVCVIIRRSLEAAHYATSPQHHQYE